MAGGDSGKAIVRQRRRLAPHPPDHRPEETLHAAAQGTAAGTSPD